MFRSCALALSAVACSLAAASAQANVLSFNFTGRISDTVLISGIPQPLEFAAPDSWLGQLVSGTIRMDLTNFAPAVTGSYAQVGANWENPDTSWVTISIRQPDGSTLVVPSGPAAALEIDRDFCPECDDAYSYIANGWGSADPNEQQDGFYLQRTLINGLEPFPRQGFSLNLASRGLQGTQLVDSIDYRDVNIDPSQATWNNYGTVEHHPAAGERLSYAFTVLAVGRQVPAVPEPSVYLMAGAGMLLLAWRRVARRGRP